MSGAVVEYKKSCDNLAKFFSSSQIDEKAVLSNIGGVMVAQTRDRLETTKKSPSGKSWVAWSEKYKKTRHGNQGLLNNMGDLTQSIAFNVNGDTLYVGSDLSYAGTHNYGDNSRITRKLKNGGRSRPFNRNIPRREFLGMSKSNEVKIYTELDDYMNSLLKV